MVVLYQRGDQSNKLKCVNFAKTEHPHFYKGPHTNKPLSQLGEREGHFDKRKHHIFMQGRVMEIN